MAIREGASLEKVWTVALDRDGLPVLREWYGVKIQAPRCSPSVRWFLCKDPGRTTAFTLDADKVFPTRAKALASTKPFPCYFVKNYQVEKGKGYYDGNGILLGTDIDGHRWRHHKMFRHEAAANTELRRQLTKHKRELMRGVKKADRVLSKLTARRPRKLKRS
jgi:hypothetical protein